MNTAALGSRRHREAYQHMQYRNSWKRSKKKKYYRNGPQFPTLSKQMSTCVQETQWTASRVNSVSPPHIIIKLGQDEDNTESSMRESRTVKRKPTQLEHSLTPYPK